MLVHRFPVNGFFRSNADSGTAREPSRKMYSFGDMGNLENHEKSSTENIVFQRTLKSPINCSGIALHSGDKAAMTPNPCEANSGIVFMRTADFQDAIPLTNWMFPAAPHSPLPDSFRIVPKPEKHLTLDGGRIEAKNADWLRAWSRTMAD